MAPLVDIPDAPRRRRCLRRVNRHNEILLQILADRCTISLDTLSRPTWFPQDCLHVIAHVGACPRSTISKPRYHYIDLDDNHCVMAGNGGEANLDEKYARAIVAQDEHAAEKLLRTFQHCVATLGGDRG